jgi:hypothetical protein
LIVVPVGRELPGTVTVKELIELVTVPEFVLLDAFQLWSSVISLSVNPNREAWRHWAVSVSFPERVNVLPTDIELLLVFFHPLKRKPDRLRVEPLATVNVSPAKYDPTTVGTVPVPSSPAAYTSATGELKVKV